MSDEKRLNEWRKRYRESVRFLPVALGTLVVLAAALFVLNLFTTVPLWAIVIVLGVSTFTVVGDVINIVYLGSKLRRAGKETRAPARASKGAS